MSQIDVSANAANIQSNIDVTVACALFIVGAARRSPPLPRRPMEPFTMFTNEAIERILKGCMKTSIIGRTFHGKRYHLLFIIEVGYRMI